VVAQISRGMLYKDNEVLRKISNKGEFHMKFHGYKY
jgi:hypothetical protein